MLSPPETPRNPINQNTSESDAESWSNRRIFWLLAVGTLIVSLIWHAPQEIRYISEHIRELFITVVLSMTGAYLLRPAVRTLLRQPWLNRQRSGRMWATILVFVGCGLVIWLFVLLGLKPVVADVREMWSSFVPSNPEERARVLETWKASLQAALEPYRAILPISLADIERETPGWLGRGAGALGERLSKSFSPGFLVELILVPVLIFYFLTDGPAIRAEARLLAPLEWRARGARMMADFDRVLDGYIRGQVWMCIIAWILVTLGLLVLGVPYAFTLGMVAGLTRAVPVIGPLLGGIPLVVVCLITTQSMEKTSALLIGFTLMHFLESKVLLPKIIGHEVDLHPVSVIISLLIGMEFFGFLGVFLAVPIAAVLKIFLTEYHEARLQKARARGDEATAQAAIQAQTLVDPTNNMSENFGHPSDAT